LNWGFIGYGRIAQKFMDALKGVESETPYAIASRSNATELSNQFPDLKMYDSYERLYQDAEVDIVYISTTHNFHRQNVLDALRHGKHVLSEKPLGLTVAEVEEMVAEAKGQKSFLMEGLWSRFLPGYQKAKEIALSGEIGELRLIKSDFAFYDVSHKGRLYDPKLAGGSNYDVNIYNLALVHDIFGNAVPEMNIQVNKYETGTDLSCSSLLSYSGNRRAQIFSSIELQCENSAWIYGTKGWLKMEEFWKCQRFHLHTENEDQIIELPFVGNGYFHEIVEAVECVKRGEIESKLMSHQHSLELARLLEQTERLIENYEGK